MISASFFEVAETFNGKIISILVMSRVGGMIVWSREGWTDYGKTWENR
jgi:hypothetical protein